MFGYFHRYFVRYLASYLKNPEVHAKTLVIETPYVDRHYLEEYKGYYATSLRQPEAHPTRICERALEMNLPQRHPLR